MSVTEPLPCPPFDPELEILLAANTTQFPSTTTVEEVHASRKGMAIFTAPIKEAFQSDAAIVFEERLIPGPQGDIPIVILRPAQPKQKPGPGFLFYHGGALITGDPYVGITAVSNYVKEHDAVVVSVHYRLAPDYPGLGPVNDCYAALSWVADNSKHLGIDPERLIVSGVSAGGGLAAGTALMARDKGSPKLYAQLLICPMLDDRNNTVSALQMPSGGTFNSTKNKVAWGFVLGDQAGRDGVSYYVAPARATNLSGLPPAYIDAGSVECFRDEDVAYASKLWESGVQAELHIWAGGFHGFDGMLPTALVSQEALRTRDNWIRRILK